MIKFSNPFYLLLFLLMVYPAEANDSSAAIGLGGLQLQENDAISMDSEILYLSMDRVKVTYQYTNTTDQDIDLLVSFPLPAIPHDIDSYLGDRTYPDWQAIDFQTKINGDAVPLKYRDVVTADDQDVTQKLQKLGWSPQYWLDRKFEQTLQQLTKDERDTYVAEGLLKRSDHGDQVYPDWKVATHVTRNQVFPANQTVTVEHSYKPIIGGSLGGNMSHYARDNSDSGFQWFKKTFCIDDQFFADFDKIYAARDPEKREQYIEQFLEYRLAPGANWKGPIKEFRLIIETDKPENLLSICIDGLRQISPTQFEVTKTNFEPTQDLNILLVRWFNFP
ncbi:MAG: DUF4424 family protein [Parasphingorhabdus sp.]|uniref:DUF4424 family protein n=1 Tax=Parasphingorhabdus sp. TaxID=2709688 RepID=UPI0032978BB5